MLTRGRGLTSAEARKRLAEFGENRIPSERRADVFTLFIAQFKSPIILGVVLVTVLIPHVPFAAVLGFGIVPPHYYPILALIILAYVIAAESAKRLFYRKQPTHNLPRPCVVTFE
jgi:magnesium-transporting ATPase (P-type)